jgi:tetratricopeptide (TPR) repeat protein
MGVHYSPEEIEEGLTGRLPPGRVREILRHFLRGCPQCRAAAWPEGRSGLSRVTSGKSALPALPAALSAAYNAVLDRTEDFARRATGLPVAERETFRKALSFLQKGGDFLALPEAGIPLAGLGVCEALLSRSWALRYEDPRQMCELARAAVEITHDLDAEVLSPWTIADWAARAWGEMANALRVADRLREAKVAFEEAYGFFQKGSGEPRVLIRLLDLEASLLGTLREFRAALDRLAQLASLYRVAGEDHLAGRTLITQALYTYYQGSTEAAYALLEEGISLVDPDRDPSLLPVIAHNRLLILVECGRFPDAERLLADLRSHPESEGRIGLLKLRSLEGEIRYGLGDPASAEAAFREVREGFQELDMSFAAAIQGLFLAMALMRQGKTEAAVQETLTAATLFHSLSIHRELLGTVLLLQEVIEKGKMSLSLLETTARFLRRKQVELGIG